MHSHTFRRQKMCYFCYMDKKDYSNKMDSLGKRFFCKRFQEKKTIYCSSCDLSIYVTYQCTTRSLIFLPCANIYCSSCELSIYVTYQCLTISLIFLPCGNNFHSKNLKDDFFRPSEKDKFWL